MINGEKELVEMLDCVRDILKDLRTFKRLKVELNKSLMNDTMKELFGEHRIAYLYRGAAISDIANTDMLDVCEVENMDDVRKLFRDIEKDIMAFQEVKKKS